MGGKMETKTVSRALVLLKEVASQPLKVQELADRLGVHKSTISRLSATLEEHGFLRLNNEKKYELGYSIFELAHIVRENLDIRKVARPYLEKLGNATLETIHLGILDGWDVVYIDKIDCKGSIRMYSRIGRRAPAYCTGIGKALLAFNPLQEIDLNKVSLKKFTKNTLSTKEDLFKELETIREGGLAWDRCEHEDGISCIAAPVFDFSGSAIASISISKYSSSNNLTDFIPVLLEGAQEISRRMGYVPAI